MFVRNCRSLLFGFIHKGMYPYVTLTSTKTKLQVRKYNRSNSLNYNKFYAAWEIFKCALIVVVVVFLVSCRRMFSVLFCKLACAFILTGALLLFLVSSNVYHFLWLYIRTVGDSVYMYCSMSPFIANLFLFCYGRDLIFTNRNIKLYYIPYELNNSRLLILGFY